MIGICREQGYRIFKEKTGKAVEILIYADNQFAGLAGQALREAIVAQIKAKKSNIHGYFDSFATE